MSSYIGIDPGGSGGLAAIKNGQAVAIPMPMAGDVVDGWEVMLFIQRYFDPTGLICIEKVGSMPKQGIASTFKFGERVGVVVGVAQAVGMPMIRATPQRWKKAVLSGLTHDKEGAFAFCRSMFPTVNLKLPRCRNLHDGMADALCMAQYALHYAQSAISNTESEDLTL